MPQHRWKKGESGNPGGRPATAINKLREFILSKTKDGHEMVTLLLEKARDKESSDQVPALRLLMEYTYGKPQAAVEVTGKLTLEDLVVAAGEVGGE